jgi:hypothetical protein
MHEPSRQGVGPNCQAAANGQSGPGGSGDSGHSGSLEAVRPGHHGYYTHRAGEGIVFVPYGLSPSAK